VPPVVDILSEILIIVGFSTFEMITSVDNAVVNADELMHSQGSSLFDIRLSKEDQATVLNTGEALPHRVALEAGWVGYRVTNPDDLATAKKIPRMAFVNAGKNLEEITARRMRTRP
jgi:Family of unknown function (DUF5519)